METSLFGPTSLFTFTVSAGVGGHGVAGVLGGAVREHVGDLGGGRLAVGVAQAQVLLEVGPGGAFGEVEGGCRRGGFHHGRPSSGACPS